MYKAWRGKAAITLGALMVAFISSPASGAQPTAAAPTAKMQKTGSVTINQHVITVSGRLSVGVLNGEINEIVYDPNSGRKVSHLEWDLENTVMVGAGLSITPASWLTLNIDLATNVSEGTGSMDDYDWLVPGAPWSDWSTHDDMEVDNIFKFDLNAEVPLLKQPNLTLTGILGIKREEYDLNASGGDFIYSVNGFRDTVGSFRDDVMVISYEQIYTAPYIGVGFVANLEPVTLSGRLIGSPLVDLEATDVHYLRNLEFTDDFETGSMIGLDVALSYAFSPSLNVMCGFHYLNYDEVQGSTTIKDLRTGQTATINGDAAGSDNSNSTITAALVYTF